MQPAHLVSAVTILPLRVLTRAALPVHSHWPRKRSETTRTNEEEDLVFKYSAIRASSNGQESPSRIHCRYGPPSPGKLYIFIPRPFSSIILPSVAIVTPVFLRTLISLLILHKKKSQFHPVRKIQKIIKEIAKDTHLTTSVLHVYNFYRLLST